jgi:hypothetical protein
MSYSTNNSFSIFPPFQGRSDLLQQKTLTQANEKTENRNNVSVSPRVWKISMSKKMDKNDNHIKKISHHPFHHHKTLAPGNENFD